MANPLTRKQAETLKVLRDFEASNGYYPSVRELAGLLGVSSTAAHFRLHGLKDAGRIRLTGGPFGIEMLHVER